MLLRCARRGFFAFATTVSGKERVRSCFGADPVIQLYIMHFDRMRQGGNGVKQPVRIALLCAMIILLAFLVPAPGLAEEAVYSIAIDADTAPVPPEEGYLSAMEYQDPTLQVTIETDRYLETDIWIARVKIADASQLRTAMAGRYGTQKVAFVSTMAKRVNAVLAINGDYFGYHNSGVVIRQGHAYRRRIDEEDRADVLVLSLIHI